MIEMKKIEKKYAYFGQDFLDRLSVIEKNCQTLLSSCALGADITKAVSDCYLDSSDFKNNLSISELIKSPLGIFSRKMKLGKIDLEVDVKENVIIFCDKSSIQQLFICLIDIVIICLSRSKKRKLIVKTWSDDDRVFLQLIFTGVFCEHLDVDSNGEDCVCEAEIISKITSDYNAEMDIEILDTNLTQITVSFIKPK